MRYTQEEKEIARKLLEKYRGQTFGCVIKSVSRSGMSRKMEFYTHDFTRIGYYIAKVIDYPYDADKGMSVAGCGMDMVFHVLQSLNHQMTRASGKLYTNASNYTLL